MNPIKTELTSFFTTQSTSEKANLKKVRPSDAAPECSTDMSRRESVLAEFRSLSERDESAQIMILGQFTALIADSSREDIIMMLSHDLESALYTTFMRTLPPTPYALFMFPFQMICEKYHELFQFWTNKEFLDALTARALRIDSSYALPDEYYEPRNFSKRLLSIFCQVIELFPDAFDYSVIFAELTRQFFQIRDAPVTEMSIFNLITFLLGLDNYPLSAVAPLLEIFRRFPEFARSYHWSDEYLTLTIALCNKDKSLATEFLTLVSPGDLFSFEDLSSAAYFKLLRVVLSERPDLCLPCVDINRLCTALGNNLDDRQPSVEILRLISRVFEEAPETIDTAIVCNMPHLLIRALDAPFDVKVTSIDILHQILTRRADILPSLIETPLVHHLISVVEDDPETTTKAVECLDMITKVCLAQNITSILPELEKLGRLQDHFAK